MLTAIKEWAGKQSTTFSSALYSLIAKNDGMNIIDWLLLFSPFLWQFQGLLEHRHARTRIQQCCLRPYSSYSILPFRHYFLRGKFYHTG